jgi:two-component system response regulator (stage 0 sporulation protein A)
MTVLEKKLDALMRYAAADNDFEKEKLRKEIRTLLCETDPEVVYHEKEKEARRLLLALNAPDHMVGFPYLVDAILLTMKNELHVMNMSWGIYAPLAKKYSVGVTTVQRGITNTVDAIWDNAPIKKMERLFPGAYIGNNGKVSNGKFISRIANVVKYNLYEEGVGNAADWV